MPVAALFRKPGPNGQACIACHADPKAAFKRWAAELPKWEPRLKKVLGAEEFIARHAKATTGADVLMETQPNIDLSIYLHNLAQRSDDQGRSVEPRRAGRLRARRGAVQDQGRTVQLCVHRLS